MRITEDAGFLLEPSLRPWVQPRRLRPHRAASRLPGPRGEEMGSAPRVRRARGRNKHAPPLPPLWAWPQLTPASLQRAVSALKIGARRTSFPENAFLDIFPAQRLPLPYSLERFLAVRLLPGRADPAPNGCGCRIRQWGLPRPGRRLPGTCHVTPCPAANTCSFLSAWKRAAPAGRSSKQPAAAPALE